ncbi:MAG: PGDYG domain-containing protein [Sulfuritalea sp.]|nr:PGDYG domain-containing protein [Sulfuritalea sp.]
MLQAKSLDLTGDDSATLFVKDEVVEVAFAVSDGELTSREGPNRYQAGDALITGSTGDRWSVSRARFEARYTPVAPLQAGRNGRYRANPVPVLARQMPEAFTLERSAGGDVLHGLAHDWLLQYAPGDFGVIENRRFQRVYRPLATD